MLDPELKEYLINLSIEELADLVKLVTDKANIRTGHDFGRVQTRIIKEYRKRT